MVYYSNLNNGKFKNEECNIKKQKNQSSKMNNLYQITTHNKTQITTKKEIVMPFESNLFGKTWNTWKEYKRVEKNFKFKSEISEQTALVNLQKISNNNETHAIEIIHNAIAQGWAGLYADKKGKTKKGFDNTKYLTYIESL
jgi:hypothetical protein